MENDKVESYEMDELPEDDFTYMVVWNNETQMEKVQAMDELQALDYICQEAYDAEDRQLFLLTPVEFE